MVVMENIQLFEEFDPEAGKVLQWFLSAEGKADMKDAEDARRSFNSIGRNDPCTCGSGKKYKKCCME